MKKSPAAMERLVNIRVKSGNREQERGEEEGVQLRLEMQATLYLHHTRWLPRLGWFIR